MSSFRPGTSEEEIRRVNAHMYADDPAYTGGNGASGGKGGTATMPINELMDNRAPSPSVAGKGGQAVASAPPTIPMPQQPIWEVPEQSSPTFNPNPIGGKGGQDPSLADPSWRPLPPTIPQQPAETPTFNPNPMGGKGGQQQRPTFNPYPMGGKGGYGGMQGGKGGYGQVSVNPYVQGGKGGYGQPSVNQSPMGGKGGYGQPSPYSQPMGGKGGGSMPQSIASSSGGKGGQQTGGNPYAIARPSASSGGKGGSTGGKGG